MIVYRITHIKYANQLIGSGVANRWNLPGQFVIYTASSKSLACLENLVYSSGETLRSGLFKCLEIFIPENLSINTVFLKDVSGNYNSEEGRILTQEIGNKWYSQNKDLLLKVPSAIIQSEYNFVINTRHHDFKKVKIIRSYQFVFDKRLGK